MFYRFSLISGTRHVLSSLTIYSIKEGLTYRLPDDLMNEDDLWYTQSNVLFPSADVTVCCGLSYTGFTAGGDVMPPEIMI